MTGFEIHDTLGEGLEPAFLNTDGTAFDTDKVTVTRDNSPISGVRLSYNSGTRTLTISNMKEGEGTGDITITYSTTIPNKYLLPESGSDTWGGSSKGGTVSNTAKLYASEDGTAIETPLAEATATHKVEPIQYLEKTGEKVNGNPRLLEWTVTVDRGIAKDADFTLTDTLPPSLTLVQTANDLPEGVSVPTGESYTPTLNSNPCTLEVEDNTFTLEIGGDSGNSFKDDGTATLVYYTTVAESYFEDDDTPLGDNVASLSFDLGKPGESDPYTTQVSVPVGNGDGGVGVDTARVTKTAGDYDPTDRTVQWTVTINPNQADLKSASLTDNLSYMEITGPNGPISNNARSCGVEGHEKGAKLLVDGTHKVAVTFEGDYNGTYEATEDNGSTGQSGITTWTITENTEGITGGDGNTNPSVPPLTLLQLKYDPKTSGENKVLTISVPENMEGNGKAVGKTSITVTFYTQFTDPCVYAGNGKATTAKNEISSWKITLGDSEGGSSEGSGEVSATVPLNTKMLEKQPPVYDYATNTFTWTVVVNEANLPLTGLTLTDELPNGLTYVKDSLKVNGSEPATGITAEQEGQTLTINLGDLSTEATLTFETTANPDALGFDGPNNVEIENTIEMRGKAYTDTDEFETVSSKTEETFANHGLVKNGELDEENELIEYEVLINPFHVPLSGATLTDTLPAGLRLDPTTVKLYQATVSGENKGDDDPTVTRGEEMTTDRSFTNEPEKNSFTVTLPTGDDSYVLVYAADVLDPDEKQTYMNKIAFNGQMLGGPEENGVSVTGGGGGGAPAAGGGRRPGPVEPPRGQRRRRDRPPGPGPGTAGHRRRGRPLRD